MSRTVELVFKTGPAFDLYYQQEHGPGAYYTAGFARFNLYLHQIAFGHIIKIILFTLAVLCIFRLTVWHAV